MASKIVSVDRKSPADRAGVRAGESLQAIDGHPISDVLDYKFYGYDPEVELTVLNEQGEARKVSVRKR